MISRDKDGLSETIVRTDEDVKVRGTHNVENVLAAIAAATVAGATLEPMRQTVRTFDPVEHRLEFVAEIEGVRFYNDSKATSVDATLKALEAFSGDSGKVVLIIGGAWKESALRAVTRSNQIEGAVFDTDWRGCGHNRKGIE